MSNDQINATIETLEAQDAKAFFRTVIHELVCLKNGTLEESDLIYSPMLDSPGQWITDADGNRKRADKPGSPYASVRWNAAKIASGDVDARSVWTGTFDDFVPGLGKVTRSFPEGVDRARQYVSRKLRLLSGAVEF